MPGATEHGLLHREVSVDLFGDRQLLVEDDAATRGHHLRVKRHLDHHVREASRHEREDVRVVVAQVVAPPERVVDAAAVEARDIPLEVPKVAAEEVDLLLRLAAVLSRQDAARRNTDVVEADRVGPLRREELVIELK